MRGETGNPGAFMEEAAGGGDHRGAEEREWGRGKGL